MAKQGADNSGSDGGAGDGGGESPKFVTADDLARVVNAAITTHSKRQETKIAELIAAAIKPAEQAPEKPAGGAPDATSAALAKLQADLAQERKAREDERREREAERAKALKNEQSAALATALRDAGVTDKVMARAAQAMLETEGVVTRDDSGAIRFRTVDKYGTETLVDLSEGLSAWTKTDGQAFLPPRKVAGSGNTPPRGGAPTGGKPDPKSEKMAEAREIFNSFVQSGD